MINVSALLHVPPACDTPVHREDEGSKKGRTEGREQRVKVCLVSGLPVAKARYLLTLAADLSRGSMTRKFR